MTNPALRDTMIEDTKDFYADIQQGLLPAVSFVKLGGLNNGHPNNSTSLVTVVWFAAAII